MKDETAMTLFQVYHPSEFKSYENHRAAIEIQLYELIENAVQEKDDPVILIEGILGITYTGGATVEEIAWFLLDTDQMRTVLHELKEAWNTISDTESENSLAFATGNQDESAEIFAELSLRTYLEALTKSYENV